MLEAYEKVCAQPGRPPLECAPVKEEAKDESFIIVVFTSRIGSKVRGCERLVIRVYGFGVQPWRVARAVGRWGCLERVFHACDMFEWG